MAAAPSANMWTLLRDDDPGHDPAVDDDRNHEKAPGADASEVEEEVPPADNIVDGAGKRGKKITKKKAAGNKKNKEKETPAALPSIEEEEGEEEEEEMNGASRCRAVAKRIWRAAVVGMLLALWCHLTSAPPVAAGHVV